MNENKNIAKWYPYSISYDSVNDITTKKPITTTHGRDEAESATEWEEIYGPMYMCSACGHGDFESNYCPNCGAKMDFSIIGDYNDV